MTNVNVVSVSIRDTGKRRISSATVEETDIVNSGSTLSLNAVRVRCEQRANINSRPVPGLYENDTTSKQYRYSEIDAVGIEMPVWTVEMEFDMSSATDLQNYGKVMRLSRTKGYKTFYCSNLVEYLAYEENYYGNASKSTNTTISSINVRIDAIDAEMNADSNRLNVRIQMRETV